MIQAKFWGLGSLTDKELQVLDSNSNEVVSINLTTRQHSHKTYNWVLEQVLIDGTEKWKSLHRKAKKI